MWICFRMKLHQRVAHGLHPQLKLPKNYQQRMQHIDESSGLQRPSTTYNCKECNESFPTTAHRRHHVERIHQSELTNFCHSIVFQETWISLPGMISDLWLSLFMAISILSLSLSVSLHKWQFERRVSCVTSASRSLLIGAASVDTGEGCIQEDRIR